MSDSLVMSVFTVLPKMSHFESLFSVDNTIMEKKNVFVHFFFFLFDE
jgi:hypothetical protein